MLKEAERLVKRAGGDVEVYLARGTSLDVEVENNKLGGSSTSTSMGGSVRAVVDGRVGFAYFTHPDRFDRALERAKQHARHAPKLNIQFPGAEAAPEVPKHWDDELAELRVEDALSLARRIVAADRPAESRVSGGASLSSSQAALANSEGAAWEDQGTGAQIGLSLVLPEGETAIQAWDDLETTIGMPDVDALASKVMNDVLSLRNPAPAKGGEADVILRGSAGSELVASLISGFVLGDNAKRGKSPWAKHLDTQVASNLTVTDDPHAPMCAEAFDGDGFATRRQAIIANGELKSFTYDLTDAAEHGEGSTRHGLRGSTQGPPGTGLHYLRIESTETDEQLLSGVDHGYLVGSVLGAHTANGTTGDFSVSAPNAWRIENGAIAGPVSDMALGGNMTEWLQRLDGVGSPDPTGGGDVPNLRFRNVTVSA